MYRGEWYSSLALAALITVQFWGLGHGKGGGRQHKLMGVDRGCVMEGHGQRGRVVHGVHGEKRRSGWLWEARGVESERWQARGEEGQVRLSRMQVG